MYTHDIAFTICSHAVMISPGILDLNVL